MKYFEEKNVLEAARERVNYILDEFDTVAVSFSGGKDSTVIFHLVLDECEKRGRLPLPVVFIDQEAEWQATIDYVKTIMYDKRVKPYWLQVPIKLFNATSHTEDWLWCWREGDTWMREKDPIAIKENTFGTDRFKPMFGAFMRKMFPKQRVASFYGLRCEESPMRAVGLTGGATYKWVTWGNRDDSYHYAFSPIYDWSYTDIWKYIHDNHIKYNKVYDYMYRYGVPIRNMRVSNLNHETATRSLYYLQEVEPETWNKLTKRLNGVDTTAKIGYRENFICPRKLPFMFKSWKEYRDYLLENLVKNDDDRKVFKKKFDQLDKAYIAYPHIDYIHQSEVVEILSNDYYFTKLDNWLRANSYGTKEYDAFLREGKLLGLSKENDEMIKKVFIREK